MQYPKTQPGVDLSGGKFTDGNPALSIPASRDRAADMNLVYDELIAVVVAAGLTPAEGETTQVRDAILAMIKGGDYKDSVRVASTAAINLAAPGANIDGVAMVAGDRFLEKDNATASARGIYIWNGAAAAATRALDADTGAELNSGAIIPVTEGAVNADTNWQITNDGTVTIGTTGLTFQPISNVSAASEAVAGKAKIATQALTDAGTDDLTFITPLKLRSSSRIKLGVETALAGTSFDVTGIPSWANRITVLVDGLNNSVSAINLLQLGTSGGIDATGYSALATDVGSAGATGIGSSAAGFPLTNAVGASADNITATVVLNRVSATKWIASGTGMSAVDYSISITGTKTLTGALDRIRLTTIAGSPTFSSGTITVNVE